MMRNESIEKGVALHLLILPPHLPSTPLQPFPSSISQSLFATSLSHLTTSISWSVLPASPNSQLSANGCEIGEDSVSSISPLAFVLTSAKPNVAPPPITQAIRTLA
jgi:hypothetical protein